MKRWHLFLGSSVLVGSSLATACGTSSENDYGGAGGSSGTGTGQATKASGAGNTAATKAATAASNNTPATNNTPASNGNTTGGGNACSMLATYGECIGCYCEANEAGCTSYYTFEDEACLCGAGSDCESQCSANYCMGDEFMGSMCETCYNGLTGMEACFETAYNNCMADATCSAYLAGESAACDALPE